ncbi:Uncharacterised protein [Mycobacteroides abscessus subsp. abscessus]|nr:Uncharacterised protein [Mycobacteroides abscessus subsp. abscessus]
MLAFFSFSNFLNQPHLFSSISANSFKTSQSLRITIDCILQFCARITNFFCIEENCGNTRINKSRLKCSDIWHIQSIHHISSGEHCPTFFAIIGRV